MRIKFRAWDKSGGEVMLDVYAIDFFLRRIKFGTEKDEWRNWDDSGDIILMQFIDLLDKNGKKIYEGDIVKFQNNGLYDRKIKIGVVTWWQQELGWYAKCPKEKVNERDIDYEFEHIQNRHIYAGKIEVLGNIYENPELLEGGVK